MDIAYRVPFYLEANYTINQYDYFNSRTTLLRRMILHIISSEQYAEGV